MNNKPSLDDYLITINKKSRNPSKQQIKRKQIDSLTKISKTMFSHYKQSTNIHKRKKDFDYKSICESLITKPTQLKTSINIEDIIPIRNKSKQNTQCSKHLLNNPIIKNNSKKVSEIQSVSISYALNTSNNFINHNKNKSSVNLGKKKSASKDKERILGIGTNNCSINNTNSNKYSFELCDYIKTQLNINNKCFQKSKQQKIKESMLNNHINHSDKSNDELTRIISIKKNKKQSISRTNSNSNLDQTTKTSTEATTTASKRLNDHSLKLSSNNNNNNNSNNYSKPFMQNNNFNLKLNKNFSSFYSNQFNKNQTTKTSKGKRNIHLNNSIYNPFHSINKTMNNPNGMPSIILNTEEEVNQCNDYPQLLTNTKTNNLIEKASHIKGYNESLKSKCISETLFNNLLIKNNTGNKIKLNDTASLSLLSEDSVFNNSKHRSTSGNNNKNDTNSIANHNDSISFKHNSQKHSSNNISNTIERRSIGSSKEKLSIGNEAEPTVSYTYSDDELSSRKSRKSKRNLQHHFLNDDFRTFYSEMNHKLFGDQHNHNFNINTNHYNHNNNI